MKFPIFAMGRNPKGLSPENAAKIVNKWITIHNDESDTPTIDIDGIIGEDFWSGSNENTVKAVKGKLAEIANLKAKKIIVNINSLGGDVSHGLGIHDILAQHEAEIETNVQGLTASAATAIAQAGDVRKMSDNALYLIHQPWSFFISNVSELESDLENMRVINDRLVKVYTKRSGTPEEEIRALMDQDNGNGKWITAEDALDMGLIDEVYEPMQAAAMVIPEGAAYMPLPELPKAGASEAAEENDELKFSNIMKKELNDLLASLKGWFNETFKKEGSDEIEIPDAAQAKLTELENKIGEVGAQEDRITELEGQLETANTAKDKATGDLETATAKISTLETDLVKAKGKGTKVGGKEGQEDHESIEDDSLMASLSADLAKIKGE